MNKFYLFGMLVFALIVSPWLFIGCEKPDAFRTADVIYLDIKVIVTDKDVRPLIPDKTMEKLAQVEQVYLVASKLKDVDPNDTAPFKLLISCADEILVLMDGLDLGPKYEKPISSIRIGVKVLKNHIKIE